MVLGFLGPKMAVLCRTTVFQKMGCWNPYFYSVLGVRVFGPSCQKRGNLDPHRKEKWTDNWKVTFWYSCFCFFFSFFEGLRVRWGGPLGHLTWPLTLLISFCLFVFLVCFFVFGFFGGFKGQVRWPKGPPHLALNPPYLFFSPPFSCSFLLFAFIEKPYFPPKKAFFA